MKRSIRYHTFVVGTILLAVGLAACSSFDDAGEGDALEVHLQSNFEGEHVQVMIDGRTVFSDRVQTNHLIGLADVILLERHEGAHRIQVVVDGVFSADRRFELKDRLFIGVSFHRTAVPEAGLAEGIQFSLSETAFGYD